MTDLQLFDQTVTEADMDWLLCVLLNTDSEFRNWLSEHVFGRALEHVGAWRSISTHLGESDLVWVVQNDESDRFLALFENKIKAVAQERQFERYFERGKEYQDQGQCKDFVTVLFSPEKYSSQDSENYQHRLTYEVLQNWLNRRPGEQAGYFAYLLERAVKRAREIPPPCPEVTAFRKRIWELASAEFSQLKVPEPGEVRETWTIVRYDGFSIIHKPIIQLGEVAVCYLDLELPGRGDEVELLARQFSEQLREIGAEVVQTRKSASIRLEAPLISKKDFDDVRIRQTLLVWAQLLDWWLVTTSQC